MNGGLLNTDELSSSPTERSSRDRRKSKRTRKADTATTDHNVSRPPTRITVENRRVGLSRALPVQVLGPRCSPALQRLLGGGRKRRGIHVTYTAEISGDYQRWQSSDRFLETRPACRQSVKVPPRRLSELFTFIAHPFRMPCKPLLAYSGIRTLYQMASRACAALPTPSASDGTARNRTGRSRALDT